VKPGSQQKGIIHLLIGIRPMLDRAGKKGFFEVNIDCPDKYVCELKKRSRGRGLRRLRRLLDLKRTYPETTFNKAIEQAFHFSFA